LSFGITVHPVKVSISWIGRERADAAALSGTKGNWIREHNHPRKPKVKLTFPNLPQPSSNSLSWSTDDINGRNTLWLLQMISMESFQVCDTEFIRAAKENAERIGGLGSI
jgi:hypothetical protein